MRALSNSVLWAGIDPKDYKVNKSEIELKAVSIWHKYQGQSMECGQKITRKYVGTKCEILAIGYKSTTWAFYSK